IVAAVARLVPVSEQVAGQESSTGQLAQAPAAPKPLSVTDVVRVANPAVVSIEATKTVPTYETQYSTQNPFGSMFPGFSFQLPSRKQTGTEEKVVSGGTGFFVSKDGYLVTNRHVVEDTDAKYTITTTGGKKYTATVIARDQVLDVAILRVTGSTFSYLNLGDSDTLELGQSVIAIGFALGEFQNSISTGVISGLSRSIVAGGGAGGTEQLDKVIQTDAAINPGNSGGPLLDMTGKVIGVNVAVAQGSQNVGFSLPINSIKPVITSVRETGKIVRPYLGIRYVPVTKELAKANNLSVEYGVLVQRGQSATDLAVIPGSPANKAGIVEGDIILEIDGQKLDEKSSFANVIRTKAVGQVITLHMLSRGQTKTLSVKLEAAP
ncbi:MAG TPA: trypsin-like peptidase domain-containing protein, partial [Candidatus Paceibacterota bacterium]|nr:trypsin-like peptidase domain-containing protein [Candidatus Paceibacterota bacterium]